MTAFQPVLRLRAWLYEVLEGPGTRKAARLFNAFIITLIILNIVAVILESVPSIRAQFATPFAIFDTVSLVIFAIEYAARLWVAIELPQVRRSGPIAGRLAFAVRPTMLIDLVALLPLVLQGLFSESDLRILRIFRLLRFLSLARYSPAMSTLTQAVYAERRALLGAVILMLGTAVFSGAVMHAVEMEAQPDKFGTIPDGIWFALATLTTIGYGDAVPITPLGKVLGGVVMLCGLALFSLPIGIIATAFVNEIHRRDFVVTWGMVARVPLFAGLDAGSIAEVMTILRSRTVNAGALITEVGQEAEGMYLIADGQVRITMGDRTLTMGPNDFFGEVALLKKVRRSATATAITRCHLMVIEAADLERLLSSNTLLREQITRIADERLAGAWGEVAGDISPDDLMDRDGQTPLQDRPASATQDW